MTTRRQGDCGTAKYAMKVTDNIESKSDADCRHNFFHPLHSLTAQGQIIDSFVQRGFPDADVRRSPEDQPAHTKQIDDAHPQTIAQAVFRSTSRARTMSHRD